MGIQGRGDGVLHWVRGVGGADGCDAIHDSGVSRASALQLAQVGFAEDDPVGRQVLVDQRGAGGGQGPCRVTGCQPRAAQMIKFGGV